MYGTIYATNKKAGTKLTFSSCFSTIYSTIKQNKTLDIYVLKDFSKAGKFSYVGVPVKHLELQKYSEYLLKLGFKFTLTEETINVTSENGRVSYKNLEAYQFHIEVKENTNLSILILINCIRYLYELDYQSIVTDFIMLCESEYSDLLINNLLIAHRRKKYASNHSINNMGNYCMGYYTQEEFENGILNQKGTISHTGGIKKFKNILPEVQNTRLRKGFLEKDCKLIIETFKELYEKYK